MNLNAAGNLLQEGIAGGIFMDACVKSAQR